MGLTSLAIKSTLNSSLSDKKKSLILATILYCILLCILFLIRFWPPSDAELLAMAGGGGGGGVTVNFGDTEFGSGKDFDSKELDVKSINKAVATQETPQEDIISQDADADKTDVVVEKHEPIKKPKIAIKTEVVKPVEVKKPEVKKVDDAVANLLHGNKKGGDGTSSTSGNQGRSNGDINSNGYSESGGSGGGSGGGNGSGNGKGNGSGYDLGNRKPLNKPQPDYNCGNEYGKVVVQITVDKNGNVTQAIPGYKGSKTLDSCLMAEAKKAALKTKWQSSPDGSDKQVGTIIYVFEIKN
jgi:outer membrane biosynthesis protein TonB